MENAVGEINGYWAALKPLFTLLGVGGLSIAAVVAAAWALFKKWGEVWMENRFQKNLEAAKAEQARQMENLRHKINATFDRVTRLHSREFEVTTEIWSQLVEAYASAQQTLNLFQSYANVGAMTDAELEELLAASDLVEWEKRELRNTPQVSRQKVYQRFIDLHKYRYSMRQIFDFNVAFKKSGIFIHPAIKSDMGRMFTIVRDALFEREANIEDMTRERDKRKIFDDEGSKLFEKIETAIADRMWDSTAVEF